MAGEMKLAFDSSGEQRDGGMDVLSQRFERVMTAGIIDVQRGEAGGLERGLHFPE